MKRSNGCILTHGSASQNRLFCKIFKHRCCAVKTEIEDRVTLFIGISELATPAGSAPKRGHTQGELSILQDAAIHVQNGDICWIGPRQNAPTDRDIVDLDNRAVIPGLVDPHSHALWGGNRLQDFESRIRGIAYEDILRQGGGIHSTVRQTRQTSTATLISEGLQRVRHLLQTGVTTLEIKSGYGLDFETEMRMLSAIKAMQPQTPVQLVPTLLIHVPPLDRERTAFVTEVIETWIPHVAQQQLAQSVDVFIEKEAFDAHEAKTILSAAIKSGLTVKLHTNQFCAMGGIALACECGALSVDHLEVIGDDEILALSKSGVVATLLPGVNVHLGLPVAPARQMIEAGIPIALGTDLNPGSSPLYSGSLTLALSTRLHRLTAAEALNAMTVNAACALGLTDRGQLSPGKRADFVVLDSPNWQEIAYRLGQSVAAVYSLGKKVFDVRT